MSLPLPLNITPKTEPKLFICCLTVSHLLVAYYSLILMNI